MKSKLFIVLVLVSIMLVSCTSTSTPADIPAVVETPDVTEAPASVPEVPSGEPIKIGFYGPLTGPTSLAGRAEMQGAEMYFEEINQAGGVLGRPVEYIVCDDKSQPEEAVKCVQKLINQDNVVATVGSLHSPHIMATGPILDEFKVPTVAAGTSPTFCEAGFQYVWRALANAAQATDAVGDALSDSGLSTLAVLYQNDDYGISGKDALIASLDYMTVVDEEAYNLGDKDWSGQLIKMMAANPDVMAVWGLGDDLGPQLNQIRDLGWSGMVITAEGCTYPDVVKVAGDNVDGAVCGALYYVPESPDEMATPLIRVFLEKYLAKYGEMPASDNAYRGYDAAMVLVTAMGKAGTTDPEQVKDAINSFSDLEGLAGFFNYAEGGCEGILTSRVWKFENQALVPFEGVDAEASIPAAPSGEPIKIGFYGPLTGPTSLAGRAEMQGAEMYFEEINQAGGVLGRPVEYIVCDDKSQPEEAVKCVQKLINQDNVVATVGSLHSPHIMATGPILDEFKVPTVAAGTSPTFCEAGFQYVWRALANAAQATDAVGDALSDSGLSTLAVLYQNDDYGISGKDALIASLDYMTVVDEEAYNLGDKDWSGQLIKMMAANPDVMAVWGLGDDLGPQLNQIRDLGWSGMVITAEGCTYPDVVKVAGDNVDGAVCGALYYVPESPDEMATPLIRVFLEKYLAKYGEMPASDNAYRGYDAAMVLVTAMGKAGTTDPEQVKDAINSFSDLEGLAGFFNYAEGGCEGILTSRVWKFENQALVPFYNLDN